MKGDIVLVLSCTQSCSSPEDSFVEISHSDVPKHFQVKYHPYCRTAGKGHYAELARTIGSERKSSFSNKHIEAFHDKMSKSVAKTSTTNPYVEALHQRLNQSGGKPQMPPTLARSPVTPTPRKTSPPALPHIQESHRNEYVESVHAKLQKMGTSGRQPVAPNPEETPHTQWWMSALEKVRLIPTVAGIRVVWDDRKSPHPLMCNVLCDAIFGGRCRIRCTNYYLPKEC